MHKFWPFIALLGCADGTDDPVDTDDTDTEDALDADDAALATSTTLTSAYAEIGQSAVDTWTQDIASTARSVPADDCMAIPDATGATYNATVGHWVYDVTLTACQVYGGYSISGTGTVSFTNLWALEESANGAAVTAAIALDMAAIVSVDVTVYATLDITDSADNAFTMAGESVLDAASIGNDYDATFTDFRDDVVTASWTGTASYDDDVIAWDARGTISVTTALGISTDADLTITGVKRTATDLYAHEGSVKASIQGILDERAVTVKYLDDTPTTGEVEVTTASGQTGTVNLPLP
jgi:hypothetical protein